MGNHLQLKQFRYGADNFSYLLYDEKEALAVDGGAVDAIKHFLEWRGVQLKYTTNTHAHGDHTQGTKQLTTAAGARYLDHRQLVNGNALTIGGVAVTVIATPGHTVDSVTFYADPYLITGDTLFNATIGNCFSGDIKIFYESIKKLMALPPHCRVYAGHDYVRDSIAFARVLEPENEALDAFLKQYRADHVVSSLEQEFEINPYLRFNQPPLIEYMKARGLPVETEYQRWESLMSIE